MSGPRRPSIQHVCGLAYLKPARDLEKRPVEFKPYYKALLLENLGTYCRKWPAGKANAEVQMLVETSSKPHDIVIYMDGSVTRDRSGWSSQSSRVEGLYKKTVEPGVRASSLTMEVDTVAHAIQWLASQRYAKITYAIILTDTMNLLQKVESGMGMPRLAHRDAQSSVTKTSGHLLPWARRSQWNERAD